MLKDAVCVMAGTITLYYENKFLCSYFLEYLRAQRTELGSFFESSDERNEKLNEGIKQH
jgi:hypothetical protein